MFRPVGIFDSGMGGISVLKEAVKLLPNEQFLFYGDNAHAPYGTKTPQQIDACVQSVVDKLLAQNIKALLIACNTATAASAKRLRAELTIPVIGMEPALKPAHALRRSGQILVLATPATLRMEKFRHLMELYGEGAVPVAGYGLVECVESGHLCDENVMQVLHNLLDTHLQKPTDAIVLGCTHYPFIRAALAQVAPNIPLIDGNLGTVRQLRRVLEARSLLCPPNVQGGYSLHTTGDPDCFLPLMEQLMQL